MLDEKGSTNDYVYDILMSHQYEGVPINCHFGVQFRIRKVTCFYMKPSLH